MTKLQDGLRRKDWFRWSALRLPGISLCPTLVWMKVTENMKSETALLPVSFTTFSLDCQSVMELVGKTILVRWKLIYKCRSEIKLYRQLQFETSINIYGNELMRKTGHHILAGSIPETLIQSRPRLLRQCCTQRLTRRPPCRPTVIFANAWWLNELRPKSDGGLRVDEAKRDNDRMFATQPFSSSTSRKTN